jgi:hypothetical protein
MSRDLDEQHLRAWQDRDWALSRDVLDERVRRREEVLYLQLQDLQERYDALINLIASGRAFDPPAPCYICAMCGKDLDPCKS